MITAEQLLSTLNFASPTGLVGMQHNQGFMTISLDNYAKAFIDYAASQNNWNLEIGAAYGNTTIAALKKGAKIIANDLHKIHLDVLKLLCPQQLQNKLQLIAGKFPNEIIISENSIASILISRVLHFMNAQELTATLQMIYKILQPKGKLFLTVDTPYMGWWLPCIKKFETRKQQHRKWPGIFKPATAYCTNNKALPFLPPLVHWFDKDTIKKQLTTHGFIIENLEYINRAGIYPPSCCLDGRESIGLIASKP